ncbi:uncharacterized protein LOC120478179 [Pimephales promelas]|uniref:uncharacterized protein LOC120478179 n=1 Tax=Pimephales promelas TaxID=90988 RepID=UPI0019556030|nr:uncharacterized protein LOC120478179 [Pimephales promelas]
MLAVMKDDEITATVRSDYSILQLAHSFFNKHGQDPTKYDYIRQTLRESGRLLLILRKEFSIHTLEDAVRPAHFDVVIKAVKKVSGYDDEKHCYRTPSLALKLGHSLQKVSDILHCRALMAQDSNLIKSTQSFKTLYAAKWSELISHTALTTLNERHFNKPSTLPFTEDVQCLHLEKITEQALKDLEDHKNLFLFARPHCLTPYRGQDCLRLYAGECGAEKPELLRSTLLRKHVATLSQILNLKNHELDQVANFLGHDIRVHREYYRLPEATTQLAKISKLLLAMEKGSLRSLQGKTLEEIEIEELNVDTRRPTTFTPPPKNEESLRLWLKALNLKKPPKRPYVCSFHFVDKRPTEDHPIPEKWLGYEVPIKTPRRRVQRLADTDDSHCDEEADQTIPQSEATLHKDADTQWEVQALMDHTYTLEGKMKDVCDRETQCGGEVPLAHAILKNDTSCVLYTGLSLNAFFDHVKYLEQFYKANFKMHEMDQILMTMMKLKLNLLQGDLAERFAVSQGLVSRILSYWIDTMEEHMRIFIPWLPRDTIRSTMPQCFREKFPNTTCIIDCSETNLQKPHNLDSRGESYSHYYSSNTIKYLVAIAPCGLVMFISPAYGGRCSDKFITQESGFLEYLRPGDEVMADRGFTIRDLLFERRVNLVLPAFTHKGGQLSDEDVTATRRIANVRIHVERVIRRLKVFKIISQTVPINLSHKMDKILRICAALVNMQGEIIHEDAD